LGISCTCGAVYPLLESGGIDFLQGAGFNDFALDEQDAVQQAVLRQEDEGIISRNKDLLLPMIRRFAQTDGRQLSQLAALDCGCGSGLNVDILRQHQIDAWGVDAGRARHQQWRTRQSGRQLLSANALRLPFKDGAFDVVLSSGLIEHIGIWEAEVDGYHSRRLPDCDGQRIQFVGELARVTKPDGFILIDHPNGAFPADFWHGGEAGSIRWHSTHGDMLPNFPEISAYFGQADPALKLVSLSPVRRLKFHKVAGHWYGRLFAPMMKTWLKLMDFPLLSFLARSFMNPYLVTIATRRADSRGWVYF
jgi:SAM-dependent methyltransferase